MAVVLIFVLGWMLFTTLFGEEQPPAFTPPPATPMLANSSWIIDMVRIFWTPTVCWVQPMAYIEVPTLSTAYVEA